MKNVLISRIDNAYMNPKYENNDKYRFSYRNSLGDNFHFFTDHICGQISMHLSGNTKLSLGSSSSGNRFDFIELEEVSSKVRVLVDTYSAFGPDIASIASFLRRMIQTSDIKHCSQ